MTMTPFMQDSFSLAASLVLGAAIGLERELSDKPAGLRTNMVICIGSCLFSILSRDVAMGVPGADITRISAQILSGIGFLGAGAILREGERIVGLTTAATIWVVAAIGMAVGYRYYRLGAVTAVGVLIVQSIFTRLDARIDDLRQRHNYRISSTLDEDGLEEIKTIFREAGLTVLRRKVMKKTGLYYSEWYVSGPRQEQKDLVRRLLDNKHIMELTY